MPHKHPIIKESSLEKLTQGWKRCTNHVVFLFGPFLTPPPHRGFKWFFETPSLSPPKKKTHGIFGKKYGYVPAGCLRHKRTLVIIIICYILWKIHDTIRRKRWLRTKRRGGGDPEKFAFKDYHLLCAGSLHGFSQEKPRGFYRPPSPFVVWRGFTRKPPPPLYGRGLCTVPWWVSWQTLYGRRSLGGIGKCRSVVALALDYKS